MNGYLMQEQQWIPGEDLFVESFSSENSYGVVFEDDGQTAYFYAVEKDKEGAGLRVLDALHIQETGDEQEEDEDMDDEDMADGDEADEDVADGDGDEVDEDEADGDGDEADDDVAHGDDDDGNEEDDDEADDGNIADTVDRRREPEINGNVADGKPPGGLPANKLQIVWSNDWMKCALVIDGFCHALFNFETHGGYNINEFPPPNEFWTQGDRKLSDDMMRQLF
jgi:hypothetical protein